MERVQSKVRLGLSGYSDGESFLAVWKVHTMLLFFSIRSLTFAVIGLTNSQNRCARTACLLLGEGSDLHSERLYGVLRIIYNLDTRREKICYTFDRLIVVDTSMLPPS